MTSSLRIDWRSNAPEAAFDAAFEAAGTPGLPAEPAGPGARTVLMWRGDDPVARLGLYLREDLFGAPGRSALVGHYAARDADVGAGLLNAAAVRARELGAGRLLGPMNGSTWGRYRLVVPDSTDARAEPPFLGEPRNPPDHHEHFAAAGWSAVSWYESRVGPLDLPAHRRAGERAAAAASRGLVVTPIDMARFADEVVALHALSARAFTGNAYYSPIDADDFVAMYAPMQRLLDPELVLIARDRDGAPAGYVLTYADPGAPERLIVKTLAVDPAWRSIGLGSHLVERVRAVARTKGLTTVIHALMHVENVSMKMVADGMERFRTYALFGRTIP